MKTIVLLLLTLGLALPLRAQSYAEARAADVAANRAHVKQAVEEHRLLIGEMTPEDVLAAWGKPERKRSTETDHGSIEFWVYKAGTLQFRDGWLSAVTTSE